jgi:hypothetical protein
MKAIETVYNGYRFRSRLEARWAVFFDTLGIPYEYEFEGYQLDDGAMYLPDFLLPDQDVFVEIKGTKPDESESNKAMQLSELRPTILQRGLPGEYYGMTYLFDSTDSSGGDGWWAVWLCWAGIRKQWLFVADDRRSDRGFLTTGTYEPVTIINHADDMSVPFQEFKEGQAALLAAKQARFEHGEVPNPNGAR